jgi:ribonuclease P/MRP protein subunit RPP40
MVLPEELYELVKDKLDADDVVLKYARVFMSLLDIVSGDFFNQYCKAGNVLMLSEGRGGVDNVFSLRDGTFYQAYSGAGTGLQLILCLDRHSTTRA